MNNCKNFFDKYHRINYFDCVSFHIQYFQFDKAVELILPHSAGNDAQKLSLILHGTNQSKFYYKKLFDSQFLLDGKTSFQQENQSFLMNGIHHVNNSNVSILIEHF